ncbi:MAG: xanthine dehydrogenase family protein [Spirochaetes bacterium]|nr:xanthine dehydrogenase family protein [Spirochaetota bacterium]
MDQNFSQDFLHGRIGTPVKRLDAAEKAGGYAKYIADMDFGSVLFSRLIRSTKARAKLVNVTIPPLPDGYFYISRKDIPEGGVNRLYMITDDWRVFAEEEVRFIGETIGMLVGPDKSLLLKLENLIDIEYEELLPAFSIDESLDLTGGPLYGDDNLFADYHLKKGTADMESLFSSSETILEDEICTGFQEHVYMETQGMVGHIENGKYVITASCQCPFYMRKAVAGVLAVDLEDIIVRQAVTGGAFGGKEHFPDVIAGPLVVALHKIKKPIQIIFDRKEDISFTAKRHPSRVRFKTALDENNKIIGMDIDIAINAGAYQSCSHIVLQRALFSVNSVYDIPNVRIRGRAVATNTFPSDAFRGFGAPQGIFACEMHMSHIARELGVDDVAFKKQYFTVTGGLTVTNGRIHEDVKLPEMLDKILKTSEYDRKNLEYGKGSGRAISMSFYNHGGGFTGDGEKEIIKAKVRLKKHANKRVSIYIANVEMGQGFQTTCSKVAAKVLGIPLTDIIFETPDTATAANSGPTVASRSMMVVGRLVQKAAEKLLADWAIDSENTVEVDYVQPDGVEWDGDNFQGDAYPAYGWGICAVEVIVDPITHEVDTAGIWAVHDVGVPIDDLIVHGQVHGGVIQSLGYGSLEKLDLKSGAFYQNTLADYIIPTTMDFPSVNSDLVENPYEHGPFGAKGLGELVFDGAAAAYAAAVQKAIDKKISRIPVNPEYILSLRRK